MGRLKTFFSLTIEIKASYWFKIVYEISQGFVNLLFVP